MKPATKHVLLGAAAGASGALLGAWVFGTGWYARVRKVGYPLLQVGPTSLAKAREMRDWAVDFEWEAEVVRFDSDQATVPPAAWPELAWQGPDEVRDAAHYLAESTIG